MEITKVCFLCKDKTPKPLSEFYKHPQMSDGYLNKCKSCTKRGVSKNYRKNLNHYKEYERDRFQDPDRKKKAAEYQRKRRRVNSLKSKARSAVSNAIRDGRLIRLPCEVCMKEKSEAHHEDYSKPFEVNWLCRKHHLLKHKKKAY